MITQLGQAGTIQVFGLARLGRIAVSKKATVEHNKDALRAVILLGFLRH